MRATVDIEGVVGACMCSVVRLKVEGLGPGVESRGLGAESLGFGECYRMFECQGQRVELEWDAESSLVVWQCPLFSPEY